MNKCLLIIAFSCLSIVLNAQSKKEREAANKALIEERIELLNENLDENSEVDLTVLFDSFNSLLEHPINLNTATEEELRELFFLNEIQVQGIINHKKKFGDFISIYELNQIKSLDRESIFLMLPFVVVEEKIALPKKGLQSLMAGGRNEIWMRYQRQFQEQSGFVPDAEGNTAFLGSADRVYMRYRFSNGTRFSIGVTGEKDAGEQFFKGSNSRGFDFYSGHIFYKNKGFIKRVALGDYHAKFGQGLVTWSGYAFGKSADVTSIKRPTVGLKANTSADENLFLRGAAVTFGPEKWDFTVFYSQKKRDGNLSTDSLDQEMAFFTSIQNSGLHRTENEINDKAAILERHIGANVTTLISGWRLGLNAVKTTFDLDLERNLSFYNQFEFSASENSVFSVDYGKVYKNMNLFGELARSQNGGTALVSGIIASLNKKLSFSALYRNYRRDFHSVLNNGFGETGGTKNETGLFTGLTYKPHRKLKLTGYADRFSFPWLRFRTDAPSNGIEYLAQLTYKPSRKQEFYVRYRTETKGQNSSVIEAPIDFPIEITRKSLRLHSSYQVSQDVKMKTRIEFSRFSEEGTADENGFLFYHDVIYRPIGKPYQFTMRYAHFDMDSYDARIYAYESDLLYVFSVPPYFGRGSRIYAMAKFKIARRVDLWLRWSQWFYNDRSSISSGNNETLGNSRDEIKLQVRWKFY